MLFGPASEIILAPGELDDTSDDRAVYTMLRNYSALETVFDVLKPPPSLSRTTSTGEWTEVSRHHGGRANISGAPLTQRSLCLDREAWDDALEARLVTA